MTQTYPKSNHIEYLIVDCDSSPGLTTAWKESGWRLSSFSNSNRAERLQKGLELSIGRLVIFHHPRSLLEPSVFPWLLKNMDALKWGGFTHRFDQDHWLLRFTSFYSNNVRPRTSGVVYLDHCIYFQRELLDRPIPPIPIFEDTEISLILSKHQKPRILPFASTTSAVRFRTNGVFRQALMNQKLKIEYFLGRSKVAMNDRYEKGLNLND